MFLKIILDYTYYTELIYVTMIRCDLLLLVFNNLYIIKRIIPFHYSYIQLYSTYSIVIQIFITNNYLHV